MTDLTFMVSEKKPKLKLLTTTAEQHRGYLDKHLLRHQIFSRVKNAHKTIPKHQFKSATNNRPSTRLGAETKQRRMQEIQEAPQTKGLHQGREVSNRREVSTQGTEEALRVNGVNEACK